MIEESAAGEISKKLCAQNEFMEQNSSRQKLYEVVLSTDYFVKISKNGAINFCSGQFQTVISQYKYIVPVLPVINQTFVRRQSVSDVQDSCSDCDFPVQLW